jgi:hypothetical protein
VTPQPPSSSRGRRGYAACWTGSCASGERRLPCAACSAGPRTSAYQAANGSESTSVPYSQLGKSSCGPARRTPSTIDRHAARGALHGGAGSMGVRHYHLPVGKTESPATPIIPQSGHHPRGPAREAPDTALWRVCTYSTSPPVATDVAAPCGHGGHGDSGFNLRHLRHPACDGRRGAFSSSLADWTAHLGPHNGVGGRGEECVDMVEFGRKVRSRCWRDGKKRGEKVRRGTRLKYKVEIGGGGGVGPRFAALQPPHQSRRASLRYQAPPRLLWQKLRGGGAMTSRLQPELPNWSLSVRYPPGTSHWGEILHGLITGWGRSPAW